MTTMQHNRAVKPQQNHGARLVRRLLSVGNMASQIRQATCEVYGEAPCRINVEVDALPMVYTRRDARTDDYELTSFGPKDDPAPYMLRCVKHRLLMRSRKLRAKFGNTDCDDACTHATGDDCKCKCGGINHGIDS